MSDGEVVIEHSEFAESKASADSRATSSRPMPDEDEHGFMNIPDNVEGLPFLVTQNSKEALREQAVALLMMDLKRAEERADKEGWIDADDLEKELGV